MPPGSILTSVTRILPLDSTPYTVRPLERPRWATGDLVLTEVEDPAGTNARVELPSGRLIEVSEGDQVIGALGQRAATLEATGDWQAIGDDGRLHGLSEGGLLGACVSRSALVPPLLPLVYRGHVFIDGSPARMRDHALSAPVRLFEVPTVLIIGSSMSAGKTTAARVVIRLLRQFGLRILGAKLTGAGRYHDILTMLDAGADEARDFVDAGMPSSIGLSEDYRASMVPMLSWLAARRFDVAVIECGASPLEPYNSDTAVRLVEHCVKMTILCTGDPYAALGVMSAFGTKPDLITGVATNTEAGISLVQKLTGCPALNIRDPDTRPVLVEHLRDALELSARSGPN